MKLFARFRKAAALPFVLLLVALNVTVVVALLIYATTELRASRNSGQTEVARALAQSGIDLAAALISANSTNNGFVSYQRVTNFDGTWRLETKIGNVAPDSSKPWKTTVKSPVILHSGFASGTSGVDLNFSVAGDPTAGFIAPRTNLTGWTNLSTNMFRMDWIYVYKGDTNDPRNLVGRIAYWVDDESSKLNINYSGITNFYSTNDYTWGAGYSQFTIEHAGLPKQANMFGEKWPIQMEFGGLGGISSTNAYFIIDSRGVAKTNKFSPYPSVLAARIGTINKPGGLAITNLSQQSAFGFSATVYSKEEERSYSTGKKRFDLLNVYAGAPVATTISGIQAAIVADNPMFAQKYDLPTFGAGLYSRIQPPANSPALPSSTFGTSKIYARGMPLVNEVSVRATVANTNGTNSGSLITDVGFIVLSKSSPNTNDSRFTWTPSIANSSSSGIKVEIAFSTNAMFGLPVANQTNSPSASAWYLPTQNPGPTNSTFTGAIKVISATNPIPGTTNSLTWTFPTNITVNVKYNGQSYQKFDIPVPTNAPLPMAAGQTNVFHLVSQPSGDGGQRGDPRFNVFKTYLNIATNTNVSALKASLGTLNTNSVNLVDAPNWQVDGYAAAANNPDLVESSLFFGPDRGIPQYTGDKDQGFGGSVSGAVAGVGWLGEVPITTQSAPFLSWSTPRLWGDGRQVVNGMDFPPDWLLLDSFHMAAYPAEPATAPVAQRAFNSYGRVNINSAKPFFQVVRNSKSQSDTITDSVIVKAQTIDFREYHPPADPVPNLPFKNIPFVGDSTNATNNRGLVLSRIQQMVSDRNSSNTPYTTHFEFLAELAATNLQYNPDWWVAPNTNNPSGSIYAATNTTDRRIESIIRSLVQKFTTHGNQFSIFSLAQALQVTPSGKTNVVGEAYLQAVYERAPVYNESTGAITNSPTGAPPMRQLYLRELRY